MKDWIYDEFKHVGVDYSQKSNANVYDSQMESFRDYENEVKLFVAKLALGETNNLTVIDIGCGTGAFSIHASKYFKKIYAVDVSCEMLEIAKNKAICNKIMNIEFYNSGFLQFKPKEQTDLVFSKWALHHLPDYWKQAALLNINKMLKLGGLFYLSDVIFKFDSEFENSTDVLLNNLSKDFDEMFIEETKTHIKDEYSSFDWIIKGLIEKAGFNVEMSNTENCLESEFLCRKIKSF